MYLKELTRHLKSIGVIFISKNRKDGDLMTYYDLETAKTHLQSWLDAELAIATGQSYKIGSRELRRADLKEVRKAIVFWRNEVSRLSGRGNRRVMRIVPRDL